MYTIEIGNNTGSNAVELGFGFGIEFYGAKGSQRAAADPLLPDVLKNYVKQKHQSLVSFFIGQWIHQALCI